MPASIIPEEELQERQALADVHASALELAYTRDGIRAMRLAVNTLIREEKRLKAKEEELAPKVAEWMRKNPASGVKP